MFCTQCGRRLPEDGAPCVCGSGQAEKVAAEPVASIMPEDIPLSFAEAERMAEEGGEVPQIFFSEESEPDAETTVYEEPIPQYIQPPVYMPPVYAVQQNPLKEAIRKVAGSPVFLLAAIFMSAGLILSLVQLFVPVDFYGLFSSIVPLLDSIMPGMGSEFMQEMEASVGDLYTAQMGLALLGLPRLIAPALTVASLWMLFGSAKKQDGPKTGGLTILQVLQVLGVIGMSLSILLAVFVIVMIFALATMLIDELSYYGIMMEGGDMTGVIIAVMAVLIAIVVLTVIFGMIYTIKALNSVVRAKKAIRTGVVHKGASRFIMVCCFISAVVSLIDVYGAVQLLGVLNGVSCVISAGANLFFALTIARYNKAVKPFRVPKFSAQSAEQVFPENRNF